MMVKKYEAKDMQQAMDEIVKELGSEAVILNSRKIKKRGLGNLFQKPIVEVMVAYEPGKPRKAKPAAQHAAREAYGSFIINAKNSAQTPPFVPLPAAVPANAGAATAAVPAREAQQKPQFQPLHINSMPSIAADPPPGSRLNEIDDKISSLDSALNDFIHKFAYIKRDITHDFSPEVEKLLLTVSANQVREELALSLARETEEILKTRKDIAAYEVMHHLICEYIGEPAPITLKKFKQKVILFIGPTGVGKTTSLVKLASGFAINQKKRVGIINTDTYRIAAHEQLRTYADILDIPLGIAYRMEEVQEALEKMRECDIVFIDTAGKRPGDRQHKEDIGKIIEFARPEDIFLCVAAPTCFSAITEIVDTYDSA
ncbi:MAG: flagellar biosynthesis protein FlhF, partial [Clostridiales bacterium]|nr:flagellar biosynthesis protein FlhF [Clostridiales bacterium]